jgi:hypothetical protein
MILNDEQRKELDEINRQHPALMKKALDAKAAGDNEAYTRIMLEEVAPVRARIEKLKESAKVSIPWVVVRRLTKKFFLSIEPGKILACHTSSKIFQVTAGPTAAREGQWMALVVFGANGQRCELFKDEAAWKLYKDMVQRPDEFC